MGMTDDDAEKVEMQIASHYATLQRLARQLRLVGEAHAKVDGVHGDIMKDPKAKVQGSPKFWEVEILKDLKANHLPGQWGKAMDTYTEAVESAQAFLREVPLHDKLFSSRMQLQTLLSIPADDIFEGGLYDAPEPRLLTRAFNFQFKSRFL